MTKKPPFAAREGLRLDWWYGLEDGMDFVGGAAGPPKDLA
jgi:hypothetical protein